MSWRRALHTSPPHEEHVECSTYQCVSSPKSWYPGISSSVILEASTLKTTAIDVMEIPEQGFNKDGEKSDIFVTCYHMTSKEPEHQIIPLHFARSIEFEVTWWIDLCTFAAPASWIATLYESNFSICNDLWRTKNLESRQWKENPANVLWICKNQRINFNPRNIVSLHTFLFLRWHDRLQMRLRRELASTQN